MVQFDPTADAKLGPPASLWDETGRRHLVSDHYAEALKRPMQELLVEPLPAIVHPDDLDALSRLPGRVLGSDEPAVLHCRVQRGDGIWLNASYYSLRVSGAVGRPSIIQSSVRFHAVVPNRLAHDLQGTDNYAFADYIRVMAGELGRLAGSRSMRTLEHLLAMASLEACDELEKRVVNEGRIAMGSLTRH